MNNSLPVRMVSQLLVYAGAFALALFLPAWTLRWPAGWIFMAIFFTFFTWINLWMLRYSPGLLEERMRLGASDEKGWDRVLVPLLALIPLGWMAFISLDANRFHWSPVPLPFQALGSLILAAGLWLFCLTVQVNPYLSAVVHVQEDRGHTVISSGPYHYLRHPMYAAAILLIVGAALLLGSWYGVLVGQLFTLALARRAVLEEQMLSVELAGYTDYMGQVKYRMIPMVW